MQNSRFLKIGLALLLLINLSTLGYMWMDTHNRRGSMQGGQQGPYDFLCRELKLTDAQIKQYDVLRQHHHQRVDMLQEHAHQLHQRFFNMLNISPVDTMAVKAMADSLVATQKKIELATFYHFSQLRAILDADQKKRFDDVIQDALRMMGGPQPGRPQGPPPGPR